MDDRDDPDQNAGRVPDRQPSDDGGTGQAARPGGPDPAVQPAPDGPSAHPAQPDQSGWSARDEQTARIEGQPPTPLASAPPATSPATPPASTPPASAPPTYGGSSYGTPSPYGTAQQGQTPQYSQPGSPPYGSAQQGGTAQYAGPQYAGPQHPGPTYQSAYPPAGAGQPPYGAAPTVAGQPPGRRRRAGFVTLAVIALLVVALAGGAAGAAITNAHTSSGGGTVQVSAPVSGATAPTQPLAKVAAAVEPSVVSITVRSGQSGDEGSGVVLDKSGLILTNNHVIAAAADGGSIQVAYSSGSRSAAQIVGRDPLGDLAVIRASNPGGTPATFGNSDNLQVGDTVLAIGSPLGLTGTVSSGIVSALHRVVSTSEAGQQSTGSSIDDAIQTDAAVNPGNSGGPLVNLSGEVVGINSAIASLSSGQSGQQSGSIGLGFAIPAAQVQKELPALEKGQQPKRAVLGVAVTDGQSGGALIDSIVAGGAAAKAGLQVGDVITSLGGSSIDGADQLGAAVRDHDPGQQVKVAFTRGGAQRSVMVTLGGSS